MTYGAIALRLTPTLRKFFESYIELSTSSGFSLTKLAEQLKIRPMTAYQNFHRMNKCFIDTHSERTNLFCSWEMEPTEEVEHELFQLATNEEQCKAFRLAFLSRLLRHTLSLGKSHEGGPTLVARAVYHFQTLDARRDLLDDHQRVSLVQLWFSLYHAAPDKAATFAPSIPPDAIDIFQDFAEQVLPFLGPREDDRTPLP